MAIKLELQMNSIGWKCSLDAFTSTKYYPRSTDPLSNSWVPISVTSTDTFEVFAGITTRVDYTVSGRRLHTLCRCHDNEYWNS